MIAAVPTQLLLDSVATRYDPSKLGTGPVSLNLVITDRKEQVGIEAGKNVMIGRVGVPSSEPRATLTGPRQLILALFFLGVPLDRLQAAGLKVDGDAAAVQALTAALDPVPQGFNIVEP
jgi:alkyl sulfatase BDS1-like metallo-beta-lactamase superfamily hydrolase